MVTNVKALDINLDDKVVNNDEVETIEITSLDNISKISLYKNVKEILIKKVNIDDISFVNSLNKLNKLNIYYSKVNLKELNNNYLNELNIISSKVIDDDFSSLNNLNISTLDLEGSYITSIYTLKGTLSLKKLGLSSISNLRSIDIVTTLPKLEELNITGSEELINDKVFEYIKRKNIVGSNYKESEYKYLNTGLDKELDNIITSLNLDNLSELDKIKSITIYVSELIKYDDDCFDKGVCSYPEIGFNMILKSLKGSGVCYHYAILTNKLLNRVGIKSYLVPGFTKNGLGHEWINIYLDDRWYGLDPTWISLYELNKLKTTGKSSYFMIELKNNNSFYKNHLEDVLPSNIVDPAEVIIDPVEKEDNTEKYEITYKIFVCSLIILFIISIYFKLKKRK